MNNLIYGETGIYPLSVLIKSRIIKFWTGLISDHSDKFSSKLYNVLHGLYTKGVYCSKWIKNVHQILIETGFDCVWDSQSFLNKDYLAVMLSKH